MATKKPVPKKSKPVPKPKPKEHPKGKMPEAWKKEAKKRPAPKDPTPPTPVAPPRKVPAPKKDVKAVVAVVPQRASRGSTEKEGLRAETHYLTGKLGEELARSNQRVVELLRAEGISVQRCSLNIDPPQFMAFVNTATMRQVAEKFAAIGEAISGIPKPVPRMPTREEVAAITPPKPKMSEEVKQKLREKAKESREVKPHDNGDPVARMLRDADTLDAVYAAAAKYLGVKEKELRDKYGHLNPGQQRMNCGNRMRGKFRKENGK